MANFVIQKATKSKAKARVLLQGPAGSGKTLTALIFAAAFGGKTVVIDTEAGTSHKFDGSKYLPKGFEYDVLPLGKKAGRNPYSPERYTDAIKFCEGQGYKNIIIDSLSHAWSGEGGALELVDKATRQMKNSHYAWSKVTPLHRRLFQTIIQSPANIFGTMRTKTVWAEDTSGRKKTYRKQGTSVIQRAETDYEFDVIFAMDLEHNAVVLKARGADEIDNEVIHKPSVEFGEELKSILQEGSDAAPEVVTTGKTYPRTKTGLLNWATENVFQGEDKATVGQRMKEILDKAGLTFDPGAWKEMQEVIKMA